MLQVDLDPPARSVPAAGATDEGEDWLAEVGDVDWDDAGAPTGERASRWSTGSYGAVAQPDAGPPGERDIQRRRAIAAIAAIVVVGLAIAIPVIVFGGGGSGSNNPTEAPPAPTTPAVTTTPQATTPASTTPTTTTPSTTVPKITVPAAGSALKPGSSGAEVTKLQNALKTLGYDPGAVDGAYGPTTQAAVSKFQTDKKLSADGIVGPETAAAINTALAAQSSSG